ncbi:hypothetical protein FJ434_14410 [Mesorhizobium sp. B2-5-13]|uniref:hypothetical protein n=1 Tax=unclassified Mesorhizobium TaxID=325217 RepID=UPI00112DA3F8|nr:MULTISPECIES: hypothetical protein [unclassified Mesorhizobium]TPJ42194.1 hypothetical protein FJ432_10505 [Mesorhizobium sp. B2-6-5]TPJ86218.1 hypothetical protein FJ434_14410 [Mesorhizobium sp. B2-5-13]TPK51117.1 hypothetical protein FJ560_09900 [Mesorhizobium sp. B2-5-5]
MLRQISEDVRVNLKDRLREVRDIIRQSRHDGASEASLLHEATSHLPPFPGKGIEGLLSHAASAVDEALSIAESFVPHERPIRVDGTTVKGLGTYFPAGDEDQQLSAERLFRRDMYYLTKAVLAGLKIDHARIHEAGFAAVHAAMRRRHGDLLAALAAPGAGLQAIAATCSALLIECLGHRPIRFDDTAPEATAMSDRALDISCLAPVVLACGLATNGRNDAPEPDMLEIAILAADIRRDRIIQACAKTSPADELTPVFATLLAHLP